MHISGQIIHGKGQGRQLGFPTINIPIPKNSKKENFGVYFAKINIDSNNYFGIANYGPVPTFDQNTPLLEVHIFDFDEDIYKQTVSVELIKKIRDIKKFNSKKDLIEQIKEDEKLARNYLKNL